MSDSYSYTLINNISNYKDFKLKNLLIVLKQEKELDILKNTDLHSLNDNLTGYIDNTNLYMLKDNFINGFHVGILNIIAIIAILFGIFVIVSKNPIVSVLFLIGLFLTISVYLMILGVNFIGISYLLVYVGAVSILFIFILMLINIRISEITTTTKNSIPLAIFIGSIFFSTLYKALPLSIAYNYDNNAFTQFLPILVKSIYYNIYYNFFSLYNGFNKNYTTKFEYIPESIYSVYNQSWDNTLIENSHINTIGNVLYTTYPLWILLTSVILLLSMVGAILITFVAKQEN